MTHHRIASVCRRAHSTRIALPLLFVAAIFTGGCALTQADLQNPHPHSATTTHEDIENSRERERERERPQPNKLGHPIKYTEPDANVTSNNDDDLAAYVEATSKPSRTYYDLLAQPKIKAMCAKEHEEYCSWPMVPHCHGTFCHSHPGGEYEHTHFGDNEFAESGPRGVEPRKPEKVKAPPSPPPPLNPTRRHSRTLHASRAQ